MSKIFILSPHEVLPVLTSFIDIKNIPKQYGGELEFEWCQMPNLDSRIKEFATWENGFTEFPKGPIYWVPTEQGTRMEALARGTINKKERNTRVCTIPVAFADQDHKTEEKEALPAPPAAENGAAVPAAVDSAKDIPTSPASPASPGEDKFEDAPEEPLGSPVITAVQGIQNLSLKDPEDKIVSEKTLEVEAIQNGKVETAA